MDRGSSGAARRARKHSTSASFVLNVRVSSAAISLKVDADPGTVASHQAVSIGPIVTELVMNSLKHAFPKKKDGAIVVSYKVADADWKLTVSDNGVGKPDLGASQKKGGLGTSLVQSLAKQLDAQVDIVSDPHGRAVSITHATFKSKPIKSA
jgi:chemotaxis protein methyltransferase CheR